MQLEELERGKRLLLKAKLLSWMSLRLLRIMTMDKLKSFDVLDLRTKGLDIQQFQKAARNWDMCWGPSATLEG